MASTSIVSQTKYANLVVRVVIQNQEKYLIVQEAKAEAYGLWTFPGGKVDVGETITQATHRELLEETGVTAKLVSILGFSFQLWDDEPGFTAEYVFAGEALTIPEAFPVTDELLSIAWLSLDEIYAIRDAGKLRHKRMEAIITMLEAGHSLPISSVVEF